MTDVAELLKDKSKWADGFQTRDGRPVRVLCVDLRSYNNEPVIAALEDSEQREVLLFFQSNGMYLGKTKSATDLIPRPVKQKKWLPIMRCGDSFHAGSLFDKKPACGLHVVACIEIEFTEGEGLNV